MDGAVMRMRPVAALPVAAGGEAALAPGAQHLMFYGVSPPFAAGEEIPVTLRFEHAGEIETMLTVRHGAAPGH
jgi:copper(I)-binding protein